MRLKIVAVLPILLCIPFGVAIAGQSPAEIDAVMAKIYAADSGKWEGMFHARSIGRGTDWSTQATQGSCTVVSKLKHKCEGTDKGKDGDLSWTSNFRVENGVEYQESTNSKGESWTREYKITHAWFTDKNNYGGERTWVAKGYKDVEYEGVDTLVQMGDRFVILTKIRKKGSNDDYQYNMFLSVKNVK